jgi:hypothetical protein
MSESTADVSQPLRTPEALFYCEQHGVMNKSTDLKEKADQIAKRA